MRKDLKVVITLIFGLVIAGLCMLFLATPDILNWIIQNPGLLLFYGIVPVIAFVICLRSFHKGGMWAFALGSLFCAGIIYYSENFQDGNPGYMLPLHLLIVPILEIAGYNFAFRLVSNADVKLR